MCRKIGIIASLELKDYLQSKPLEKTCMKLNFKEKNLINVTNLLAKKLVEKTF